MKIRKEYARVIILLLVYSLVASWIMINYQSTTGAVYIAMGAISILAYAIVEALPFKDPIKKLIGIDDDIAADVAVGILVVAVIISLMEFTQLTMGYPASLYPQTAFAEQVTLFSKFMVVAFLASVGEEIVFRGWARYALWEGTGFYFVALVLSSAMFSAFHYTAYGASLPAAYVGAFMIGMLLGIIGTWRKSLVPCIVIHSMINVYLFLISEQIFVIGG